MSVRGCQELIKMANINIRTQSNTRNTSTAQSAPGYI